MWPGGQLALDIKLEDGAQSQIMVTLDAMLEYQSIQQSAGVAGIPPLITSVYLSPQRRGHWLCNEKPTVVLACFSKTLLMSSGRLSKSESDTYRCFSGL